MINQRAKRAMFHRCKTTGGYGPRFFHASIPLDSDDFPNHGLKRGFKTHCYLELPEGKTVISSASATHRYPPFLGDVSQLAVCSRCCQEIVDK